MSQLAMARLLLASVFVYSLLMAFGVDQVRQEMKIVAAQQADLQRHTNEQQTDLQARLLVIGEQIEQLREEQEERRILANAIKPAKERSK